MMLAEYEVTEKVVDGLNTILIQTGDFKGCELVYGKVSFADEPNDDGTYSISFDYNITNDYTVNKEAMDAFVKTIGDILSDLIVNAVTHAEEILNDNNGENNTEQSGNE